LLSWPEPFFQPLNPLIFRLLRQQRKLLRPIFLSRGQVKTTDKKLLPPNGNESKGKLGNGKAAGENQKGGRDKISTKYFISQPDKMAMKWKDLTEMVNK